MTTINNFRKAPWALDGPSIPSELARIGLYASTSGEQGIVGISDLKVTAFGSPAGGVQIAIGAALIRNSSASGPEQTYAVYNPSVSQIDVAPTAGTGRTDLIVVRIKDPQYAPNPAVTPGTENTYNYVVPEVISGVPGGTLKFSELGLTYSAVEIAKVTLPSSTTNITSGMITDLRNVALPRSREYVDHLAATASDTLNPAPGVYEAFPNGVYMDVLVPEWATVAKITGFAEGLRLVAAGNGKLRIGFLDGGATQVTNVNDAASAYPQRRGYNIGGSIAFSAAYRGLVKRIRMEGTINAGGDSGFLTTDAASSGSMRIRFEEAAV